MPLLLTILRGAAQIGGTWIRIATDTTELLVDMGAPLPNTPSAPLEYRKVSDPEKAHRAVLLSHGHADHFGEMRGYPRELPVWMSRGAETIIEITNIFSPKSAIPLGNIHYFGDRKPFTVGDIAITPFRVDHSAFDSFAFLFESWGARIFYTGDFRATGRTAYLFPKLLADVPKNVEALVMEGTSMRPGKESSETEEKVESSLLDFFRAQNNLTLVSCSSQNIDRLISVFKATRKAKKTLVIDPYTAFILGRIHEIRPTIPDASYDGIKIYFAPSQMKRIESAGFIKELYRHKAKKIAKEEIRDSRADIVLLYKHNPDMKRLLGHVGDLNGAMLVWSLWEGYLVDGAIQKFCEDKGITFKVAHASGHCHVQEMQRLVCAMNPKVVIPVHTANPKAYLELFPRARVLKDGEVMAV
jgi:ribonuclease J